MGYNRRKGGTTTYKINTLQALCSNTSATPRRSHQIKDRYRVESVTSTGAEMTTAGARYW
jgi:hypothetical protein